ncbi:DNA polymerase III subunit delta' [Vibrio navarrensis]|uniref:DNA polymerase III subunit delta' n=1 Tax=Vibrio navarrensis TaxID=29495 RepID=A0A099LKR4_9VIBR|nr:DNA polymerase III subunit delta' [Vibrio navarrensis]KGK08753.1 DNA polymerase III subunit delta' [Vibrio navarrensis]KGK21162.1 DNA polymerase III subunit delta' [Vibrio navarrensis]MBE4580432.1 DNA polymerase III subunit delta' [Vibrio navarrensis]MBE4606964.1 DNA polymerase III subunit delta' [Vibrio navarrensis]MBE4610268.1 DNA polymerase III subunit delta' [Vibrio navarrensis]
MVHEYPWLENVWRGLQASMAAQRLPGAVLLQSDADLGVEVLVDAFAAALLCKTYPDQACGFCHSCDLVKSNNHPDLHRILPEKEGKAIGVEQIRHCNRLTQESSQLGGYRLFIIEPAEAMNESASNALLKTLEESGEQCLFLLVNRDKKRLLPTIVSRCQQWTVTTPDLNAAVEWLRQQGVKDVAKDLLKLSHYSPLQAKAMAQAGGVAEYQKLEALFLSVLTQPWGDITELVSLIQTSSQRNLTWLWYLLSDAQKAAFRLDSQDLLFGSQTLSHYPLIRLHSAMESLTQLMQQLRTFPGLNEELLITNWIIEIREALCL